MQDYTSNPTQSGQRRLAGLLKLGALVLLVAAIVLAGRQYQFLQGSVTTQGKVVQLLEQNRSQSTANAGTRKSSVYTPEVSFTTPNGAVVHFVSLVASDSPQLQAGQAVTVRYWADNPSHAQLDRFVDQWLAALLCVVGAIVLGLLSWSLRGGRSR